MIFVLQWNDDSEKTILDVKTPGLNKPENCVLTHNRFNNYMVLFFIALKKAQIYKHRIDIVHIKKLR